jgi:hydrogenase maturation protease
MGDTPASILVVGLGNPILTDDGVGWRVAQQLRATLLDRRKGSRAGVSVDITEASVGGLSLAEMMVGYRRAIVIDSIMTSNGAPGTVYRLALDDLPGTLNTASAHDTNLITALEALRRFGAEVPKNGAIDIVAIEAQDVLTFSERCTPAVERSVPDAVSVVVALIEIKGLTG